MKKNNLKNLAVFCGAQSGNNLIYKEIALDLANFLVQQDIILIYGGGRVGLMGIIADAMLSQGGKAIGVIPEALVKAEVAHLQLTELHIVDNMHSRKKLMSDLADGFIMMPGGVGSLDEFFEIFTWQKLGLHTKPCGILNTFRYFDYLIQFLDHMVAQGFLEQDSRSHIHVADTPFELLEKFSLIPQHVPYHLSSNSLPNRQF